MANFELHMCRAAAKSLISSLNSLQAIPPEECVVPDDLVACMADLNLTQQDFLVQRAHRYLAVTVDTGALQKQISELDVMREERELEDYYLLLGAPLKLMRRLFGMHACEFSRRRKVLNIKGAGSGRPPVCSEETEHLVWNTWQNFAHTDERKRFVLVAESTELDLHIIWSSLREHIDVKESA